MALGVRLADRRGQIRQGRRREILEAAWAIARRGGIGTVSLREVGERVGMRAPSIYEYFVSKDALYDAMFAEGYRAFLEILPNAEDPTDARRRAVAWLRRFFAFCRADVARYQLLFQPAIPGFRPSEQSMRIAEEALASLDGEMSAMGIERPQARDLWTALVTGMVNQQIANDPAGNRWERMAEEAVIMFMNHVERMETGT